MDISSQMPFQFTQCGGLLSEWSLSSEHRVDPSANKDQTRYCVHVRVTLGEGRGDQPHPLHAWTGLLIADIFQEGLEERITEAIVLAHCEAMLFFERSSLKQGLPYGIARDVAFNMAGPVIWARREAKVKMTVNTVQEGHQAIADAGVKKRAKTQEPGHPRGKKKTNQIPATAYNIKEWMQSIEKDDSEVELRNGRARYCRAEPRNAQSQNVSRGRTHHRRQADHNFLKMLWVNLPLPEGTVPIKEVIKVPISQPWLEDPGKATDLSK